jgi:hypothetical protein
MTNVETTPPTKQNIKAQFATVPQNDASSRDIDEKGHMRIPDWVYVAGIVITILTGAYGLVDQPLTLMRKFTVLWRKRHNTATFLRACSRAKTPAQSGL